MHCYYIDKALHYTQTTMIPSMSPHTDLVDTKDGKVGGLNFLASKL